MWNWCLLFNLLPQLLWHIVNDQSYRTLQLNQRCPCVCTASGYPDVLIVWGLQPTIEPLTLLLSQLNNVPSEVLTNCWLIPVLRQYYPAFIPFALTKPIFIIWHSFQDVNLFYAFINYCKIVCNSLIFHTPHVHTMHWFSLYLYQLNELDPLP